MFGAFWHLAPCVAFEDKKEVYFDSWTETDMIKLPDRLSSWGGGAKEKYY